MNSIILHIPKGFSSHDWTHNYINIMPMGVFPLANYAMSRGHSCQVINSAVYESQQQALKRIYQRIDGEAIGVVGLPLHWHLAGYDVCYAADKIKKNFPEVTIVLGGYTATVFAYELLNNCQAIDVIVRGDGEMSFAALLDQLDTPPSDRDLSKVPNLCWRSGNGIRTNPQIHVATEEETSSYDYSISKVLTDIREYTNSPSMFDAISGRVKGIYQQPVDQRFFFLNIGRGCGLNCVYCAGSRISFSKYYNRRKAAIRTIDSVISTVQDVYTAGFRRFHICFDSPFIDKEKYFSTLFHRIAGEVSPDLCLLFECYNLPTPGFLEACSSSFQRVILILSPCFFDYQKMVRYKGYHFSRHELEQSISMTKEYPNLDCFIYFAITPLEEWSTERIYENVVSMKTLKRKYGCQVSAMPILAEPGSPWVSLSSQFPGIEIALQFPDFYREWKKPLNSWNETLCNLKGINDIFEQIGLMMENDSIPPSTR